MCGVCEPKGLCVSVWGVEQFVCVCVVHVCVHVVCTICMGVEYMWVHVCVG